MAKEKEAKLPGDRRVDYHERVRYAVRKAHDRLFDILRPHENGASAAGADNANRVHLDQQLRQKKRVDADEG